MSKKTRHAYKSTGKNTVSEECPNDYLKMKPVWAFSRVKDIKEWTIYCEDFYKTVIPKLKDFEGMTWNDIKNQTHDKSNRSNNHFISVADLTIEAQRKVDEQKDNLDGLFSLRITNLKRLVGILEKNVFYILWYDQKHESIKTKNIT